jgi:hypothetical protein
MIKCICKHFRFLHFITISEEKLKKKRKSAGGCSKFLHNIVQEGLINNIGVIKEWAYVGFFLYHHYTNNYRFAIKKYFVVHFILHSLGKMIHVVASCTLLT